MALFALLGAVAVVANNSDGDNAQRETQEFWMGMVEDVSSFTPGKSTKLSM